MAILVTGGSGYIGSVTVERLRATGEDIVVVDDLFRGHRSALPSNIPVYKGKIGDRNLIQRILKEHSIEACIHFAALTYVGESVKNPLITGVKSPISPSASVSVSRLALSIMLAPQRINARLPSEKHF